MPSLLTVVFGTDENAARDYINRQLGVSGENYYEVSAPGGAELPWVLDLIQSEDQENPILYRPRLTPSEARWIKRYMSAWDIDWHFVTGARKGVRQIKHNLWVHQ